ncbi:MAG: serine/threonine-protein kinase [Planctomycetota bacterium]
MESRRIKVGPSSDWPARIKLVELGAFQIIGKLAEGRGTLLFKAQHERSGYEVIAKIVKASHAKNRATLAEMSNEARVLRALQHPYIIKMVKYERRTRFPFLLLEFVNGSNLKQWIVRRERSDVREPIQVLARLAEGLGATHRGGYIHRDIKSENMLVTGNGDVRLIDFALAEKLSWRWARALLPRHRVQGTRSYMSPEQILGRSLDHRSDIYSFGVVIYEAVTGRPPFYGLDEQSLLQDHLHTEPKRLASSVSNVNADLDNLVSRMLAKHPVDRPPSMEFVVEALRSIDSITAKTP